MSFTSTVVAASLTVTGVGALGYAAAERFGPGDCGQAIIGEGSIAAECFNIGRGGGTVELGDGPQMLAARMVGMDLRMTFGEVEVEMIYPRDGETGKLTKVDWDDEGYLDFAGDVDGTRFVKAESFVVSLTPCARLANDYTDVRVDLPIDQYVGENSESGLSPDTGFAGDEKESVFKLVLERNDPVDPLKVTGIVAKTDGVAPCSPHIPTRRADGSVNDIQRYDEGHLNNGVKETFDYVTDDLAIKKAAASACLGELLDMEAVQEDIASYVRGQIAVQNPQLVGVPVSVELGSQDEIQQHYVDEYAAAVQKYKDLDETIISDSDGNHKPIDVKFTSEILKVETCDA